MIKYYFVLIILCLLTLSGCWKNDVGRSYYPSGNILSEATVRNGLLDGPSTMYYESGAKKGDAIYRSGLLNGPATSFYESGKKKAQANYIDGLLDGWSIDWSEDGMIKSKVCFKSGRLIFENKKSDLVKGCTRE